MSFRPVIKLCAVVLFFCSIGCRKEINPLAHQPFIKQFAKNKTAKDDSPFVAYTILQGQQYCVGNNYPPYTTTAMRFAVRFDSTAVYANQDSKNQHDYNKLYGFSDNRSDHHSFSARFGWRWCNNELELSAYTYNDGVRSITDLGGIDLTKEHNCAIIANGTHYDFVLDGDTTSVLRTAKTAQATGYKLLPYFGGDETAPHTITIRIKETE